MIGRFLLWRKSDSDRRAVPRESGEGLIAFYWDGGAPEGHRVRDISRRGMYVESDFISWARGTMMILTLQIDSNGSPGNTPPDMIAVPAVVVRTCADGMGLRFVPPDLDGRRKLLQFLSKWRSSRAAANVALYLGSREGIDSPARLVHLQRWLLNLRSALLQPQGLFGRTQQIPATPGSERRYL
jgi:hypothetical protein